MNEQWWVIAVLCAAIMGGCARGAPEAAVLSQGIVGDAGPGAVTGLDMGSDAGPVTGTGDGPVDGGGGGGPAGEPCMRGEVQPCPCAGVDAEGERRCLFDARSPLDGYLSDCERCPEPDAGAAGAAGMGAVAMSGEPTDTGGTTDAGGDTGGMADAGMGGSGGATASPPPGTGQGCLADPSLCSGLLQCCRQDGQCGLGADGVLCL
ncbi:MAG: hypothetical protein PVI30_20390 [Myxococcales bacterium]